MFIEKKFIETLIDFKAYFNICENNVFESLLGLSFSQEKNICT